MTNDCQALGSFPSADLLIGHHRLRAVQCLIRILELQSEEVRLKGNEIEELIHDLDVGDVGDGHKLLCQDLQQRSSDGVAEVDVVL